MLKYKLIISLISLFFVSLVFAAAPAAVIKDVRVWFKEDSTRLIFELSQAPKYETLALDNPNRFVLDFKNTQWSASFSKKLLKNTNIVELRHAPKNGLDVRVVLELSKKMTVSAFLLQPNDTYGYRLVVDIGDSLALFDTEKDVEEAMQVVAPIIPKKLIRAGTRPFIIAIDPGHGGEDTGAVGRVLKTHEKEIVLSVAKQLKTLIDNENHMRAFLVRDRDYFVPLRRRIAIAREGGADIFISLHADSSFGTVAKGASVYVLSPHGSSSEAAKWLADRENKADLVGGVSLDNKSATLASVLLDVTQAVNQSSSEELGSTVLEQLGRVTNLHKKHIERAGFVVLKSPDIPSILVELDFLSHKEGEEKLRNPQHQKILSEAVFSGLKSYFSTRTLPPAHSSMMAEQGN